MSEKTLDDIIEETKEKIKAAFGPKHRLMAW